MGIAEKIPETETALVLVDGLTPDKVYGTPEGTGIAAILKKIEDEVRGTIIDVSTDAGREAAKSLAYKVARSKTALDGMGKSLVEGWKKQAGAVDAERKKIRDTLDGLKAEVLQPVEAWEETERQRVAGHINAITEIEELERVSADETALAIGSRLERLDAFTERDWEEFAEQAKAAIDHAGASLDAQYQAALKREAERAELEQLRAKVAEQERRDREREEAEKANAKAEADRVAAEQAEEARKAREEQIAREAAERAVAEAEARRKREAEEEAAAQERRQRDEKHRGEVILAAVLALKDNGIAAKTAARAIDLIVDGKVPNVTVNF
jgi:hypothetical protein